MLGFLYFRWACAYLQSKYLYILCEFILFYFRLDDLVRLDLPSETYLHFFQRFFLVNLQLFLLKTVQKAFGSWIKTKNPRKSRITTEI